MSSQDQTTKDQTTTVDHRLETKSVHDTLRSDGRCTAFLEAAIASGFKGILNGPDLITVFAPIDEAFRETGKHAGEMHMRALICRHIIRGRVLGADMNVASDLKPLEGGPVRVTEEEGAVTYGGIRILDSDISCTNGAIHVIEGICTPEMSHA